MRIKHKVLSKPLKMKILAFGLWSSFAWIVACFSILYLTTFSNVSIPSSLTFIIYGWCIIGWLGGFIYYSSTVTFHNTKESDYLVPLIK